MTLAQQIRANPHWLPANPRNILSDVPGEDGWPVVGTTVQLLRDPPGFIRRMYDTYGPVYRSNSFGGRLVTLLGPEANELVLMDREKLFSSEQGWGPMLNLVFPRGLILLDFDHHRIHRRALSFAFKPEPMRLYNDALNEGIVGRVAEWGKQGEFPFYPAVKKLTLDLAATSFLGIPWGKEAQAINTAFIDMIAATIALIRVPLPGTAMARGVAGRKFLVDYFNREMAKRRTSDAQDIFSQICRATHEDGSLLSDDEIVDHMNFLMMAAHDTVTSSISTMMLHLARNPDWQDRLREEMLGLGLNGDELPYDRLGELTLTDYAFREALRLAPPVPTIPRRAVRPFSFGGYHFPAGTFVAIQAGFTHHMAEHWPNPETFDPMRFEPEAVRQRHKYAWVPFSGGAHMCLGFHFSFMLAKILFFHLLTRHRITLGPGSGEWLAWPIPKPKDGLPVRLEPI